MKTFDIALKCVQRPRLLLLLMLFVLSSVPQRLAILETAEAMAARQRDDAAAASRKAAWQARLQASKPVP